MPYVTSILGASTSIDELLERTKFIFTGAFRCLGFPTKTFLPSLLCCALFVVVRALLMNGQPLLVQ